MYTKTKWFPLFLAEFSVCQEARTSGKRNAHPMHNVRLQSKARDGAYCGTVFSPVDGKAIPLLITFGARTEEASQRIWMDIQNELSNLDTAHIFNVAQMMNHRPRAPFVADFLFGFAPNSQAVEFLFSGINLTFSMTSTPSGVKDSCASFLSIALDTGWLRKYCCV